MCSGSWKLKHTLKNPSLIFVVHLSELIPLLRSVLTPSQLESERNDEYNLYILRQPQSKQKICL